jgi:hypothetical protein
MRDAGQHDGTAVLRSLNFQPPKLVHSPFRGITRYGHDTRRLPQRGT